MSSTSAKDELLAYIKNHPEGVNEDDLHVFRGLLIKCLEEMNFPEVWETRMSISKLDRVETVEFEGSDRIVFTIERHGAAVMGSVCAGKQTWTIDLTEGTADHSETRGRRLSPTQKPFTKSDALNCARRIFTRTKAGSTDDGGIRYLPDGRVVVQIGNYVPTDQPAPTLSVRRRRLREALVKVAELRGYDRAERKYGNLPTFIKKPTADSRS